MPFAISVIFRQSSKPILKFAENKKASYKQFGILKRQNWMCTHQNENAQSGSVFLYN